MPGTYQKALSDLKNVVKSSKKGNAVSAALMTNEPLGAPSKLDDRIAACARSGRSLHDTMLFFDVILRDCRQA
jgi:hypothetical protein